MHYDMLRFILNSFVLSINELIDNGLNDSETDPHYSQVTAQNYIIFYMQMEHEIGNNLPYSDIPGYFRYYGYSEDKYKKFEEKRKKESHYYIGKQYSKKDLKII